MKLPNKISPDHLVDTVVEVRYSSEIPFEIALGAFYNCLPDSYFYTNIKPETERINKPNVSSITFNLEPLAIFYNDKIKVECKKNRFTFNCSQGQEGLKAYTGWSTYYNEIKNILTYFRNTDIISEYKWVGLRYISIYKGKTLNDIIEPSYIESLKDDYSIKRRILREEYSIDDIIVNLQLIDDIINLEKTSIDIDVVQPSLIISEGIDILHYINKLHSIEKEIFFTLLNKKYLKQLNIEY